jgi:hypothetical protein
VTNAAPEEEECDRLPSFSEQVADQLGGVRGMVESSVPVIAFVLANIIWSVKPALVIAVALGLAIAGFRLSRRQSARHAVNGLFGIAIGAVIAWRTGEPQDYYVPGILLSLAYGIAMIVSIALRRPLVGWIWSLVADKGAKRWYEDHGLRRTFNWLTLLWATTYLAKVVINTLVYFSDLSNDQKATVLGIMRITLGFPPYALLAALTVWAARRYLRTLPVDDEFAGVVLPGGQPLRVALKDAGFVDAGTPDAEHAGRTPAEWEIKIVAPDSELSRRDNPR